MGTLHEDVFIFMTISHRNLLKMKSILNKSCREIQSTHFIFSNFLKNCAIYEITSTNMVEPERPQMEYGSALHAGLLRLRVHKPAHMHSRPYAHAEMCNNL
jgi:hypothetical protein